MAAVNSVRCFFVLTMLVFGSSGTLAANDDVWSVSKSTGEVWITTAGGATPASLTQDANLKTGDTIRTGRNGRALLKRGEESILISPNSVVALPAEKKDGLSTIILQQAGSILLEVEKRNVQHFEVETPYLAAVVKGTQFSVTVGTASTKVDVVRGQVDVSDFKTGQIAHIMPGQTATAFEHGKSGLTLTGAGRLNPIEQGKPRASTIDRVLVPKAGLPPPKSTGDGKFIRALAPKEAGKLTNSPSAGAAKIATPVAPNVIRITQPIGEVRLNIHKVTNGLAHGVEAPNAVRNGAREPSTTVWGDGRASNNTAAYSGIGSNPTNNSQPAQPSTKNNPSGAAGIRDVAGSPADDGGLSGRGHGGASGGKSGGGNGASGNGNNSGVANGVGKGNGNNGVDANNGNGNGASGSNGKGGSGNGNGGASGNSGNGGNGNPSDGNSGGNGSGSGSGNNGKGGGNNGGGNGTGGNANGGNGNGNGNGGAGGGRR